MCSCEGNWWEWGETKITVMYFPSIITLEQIPLFYESVQIFASSSLGVWLLWDSSGVFPLFAKRKAAWSTSPHFAWGTRLAPQNPDERSALYHIIERGLQCRFLARRLIKCCQRFLSSYVLYARHLSDHAFFGTKVNVSIFIKAFLTLFGFALR